MLINSLSKRMTASLFLTWSNFFISNIENIVFLRRLGGHCISNSMFAHLCHRIVKNLTDLLYFLSQIRRNVTHAKLRRNRIIRLHQLPTLVQGSSSCKRWWRSHSSENQVELRNGGCYSTTLECRRNDRGSQFSHRAESYQ